jgi:hypothetical protein
LSLFLNKLFLIKTFLFLQISSFPDFSREALAFRNFVQWNY